MKRIALCLVIFIVFTGMAFAQAGRPAGEISPTEIGVDTAQQKLKEVSVNKFEDPGFWSIYVPRDFGLGIVRRFPGGPADKQPIPDEEQVGIKEEDKFVLGAKVQFYKRAHEYILITPIRPIPIEGITKTLSIWVVGRNNNHVLKIIISDFFGKKSELTLGKLNFSGWKKLTVAIPPTIVQRNYHYNNRMGIKVEGFRIDCDPMESYGTYFIYFDDMRAVTDLFAEESRDEDDMQDIW